MSVSFGPLCAAATATGGNVAPFNREGREAAHKSLDPRGGGNVEVGFFPPSGQREEVQVWKDWGGKQNI